MRDIVKNIMRLQDLELIREEFKIIHFSNGDTGLEKLERNYARLLANLPDEWRERYIALRKKGTAVSRISGCVCQGCRMTLNTGLLERMKDGEADHICPNCGKFLFLG